MQLLTPKANGKLLMYKGVSPPLSFCDDSRWVEAAAVVTGFETSEVTSHPGALSLKIYVVLKLLFYFINYVQIPERLKRMEQTLKKREIELDSTGCSFPAYGDEANEMPPVLFPLRRSCGVSLILVEFIFYIFYFSSFRIPIPLW